MIYPERPGHIRVIPGAASLDIILKNTHFPDDLLRPGAPIECTVQWDGRIPVLIFSFTQAPASDFSEPLIPAELKNADRGWLQQPRILVRLLLADSVIADRVVAREFWLSETDEVRAALNFE